VISLGESHDVVRHHLNSDMERIQTWIVSSRIRLNIQKSSIMWFSLKRASVAVCPPVLIYGDPLQEMETQRYLGIIFDNKL